MSQAIHFTVRPSQQSASLQYANYLTSLKLRRALLQQAAITQQSKGYKPGQYNTYQQEKQLKSKPSKNKKYDSDEYKAPSERVQRPKAAPTHPPEHFKHKEQLKPATHPPEHFIPQKHPELHQPRSATNPPVPTHAPRVPVHAPTHPWQAPGSRDGKAPVDEGLYNKSKKSRPTNKPYVPDGTTPVRFKE